MLQSKVRQNSPILCTFHTTVPLRYGGAQENKMENKKTQKKMTFNKFMIIVGDSVYLSKVFSEEAA